MSSIGNDSEPQRGDPARGLKEEHSLRVEAEAVTRTLREGLLPAKLPEIPEAEIAGYFEPASPVEVGGDFYDCFAIEPDRWLLVIADVTGKGPGAAVVASMVRYAVRTAASQGQNPPQIAATASRVIHLAREETDHRFATAAVVEVSAAADEFNVQVTVAGHPPALVATAGELADSLTVTGPMLGIEPDQRYNSAPPVSPPATSSFSTPMESARPARAPALSASRGSPTGCCNPSKSLPASSSARSQG